MKRILMISNTASMQYQFLLPWTLLLRDMGYEVHIGANFRVGYNSTEERITQFQAQLDSLGIPWHHIDFDRNALKLHKYRKPMQQIKEILYLGDFAAIHCHTPTCGVMARLLGKQLGIKVIYTAHGFHFFKGASPLHWALFYPAERLLAHWTDTLITINHEDHERAKTFHADRIRYIPGAGVELERYRHPEKPRAQVLESLSIPEDAVVFISIGEMNRNKNHAVLLRALRRLHNPHLHLIIAGKDRMDGALQALAAEYGIAAQVHFTGFRTDVVDLLHASDVFCFPSRREGLGFTAIEAMAAGLPLITSDRHGIQDYSKDGITGFVCSPEDDAAFSDAMRTLAEDSVLRKTMGRHNAIAAKEFALDNVLTQLRSIYAEALDVPETSDDKTRITEII